MYAFVVCSNSLSSLRARRVSMVSRWDSVKSVYVGGTLLDEVVVDAQARQNLRSGGR